MHEAVGIVTWIWDITTDSASWFGDLSPLLGLPPHGFDGRFAAFLARLHPDDVERSRQRMIDCLKGRTQNYVAEERVLWPDGSIHWLETHGRGEYGDDSRAVRLVGVVLDRDLGALPKMAMPVRMFAGAPLGDGRQFISWIHIEDVARMICVAVDPSFEKQPPGKGLSGIYNAAAPNPATNKEMTQQIAQVLHRPAVLPPVPAFFLRTVLGDMSALVLESARVSSLRIQETGFEFRYPTLLPALQNLLGEP